MTLRWGIKASLLDYIRRSGGDITVEGGAAIDNDGRFVFADGKTEGRYIGQVRLRAHDGMLDWTIIDPAIRDGCLWSVPDPDHPVALAEIRENAVLLAPAGAEMFSFMYGPGTVLDPLELS